MMTPMDELILNIPFNQESMYDIQHPSSNGKVISLV